MKLKLPDSLSSAQDLQSVLLELKGLQQWLSHDAVKKQVTQKGAINPPVLSDSASEVVQSFKEITPENVQALITTLQDYADSAHQVTITLAAPAGTGLKKSLVAWCRANIAPDVLVSFQFNSTLLGGMVVRHGSRIHDWSFRRQILAGKDNFPEVLRRV